MEGVVAHDGEDACRKAPAVVRRPRRATKLGACHVPTPVIDGSSLSRQTGQLGSSATAPSSEPRGSDGSRARLPREAVSTAAASSADGGGSGTVDGGGVTERAPTRSLLSQMCVRTAGSAAAGAGWRSEHSPHGPSAAAETTPSHSTRSRRLTWQSGRGRGCGGANWTCATCTAKATSGSSELYRFAWKSRRKRSAVPGVP